MFYRELFFVVISLFSLVADANPVNVSKWKKQSDEPQFQIYKTTLLNETVLPFLKTCYKPSCCSDKDNVTCAFYFDALTWAEEVKFPVLNTTPILGHSLNVHIKEFCQSTAKILNQMVASGHQASAATREVADSFRCIMACGDWESKENLAHDSCITALLLMELTSNFTETAQRPKLVAMDVPQEAGGNVDKITPAAEGPVQKKPAAQQELPVKQSNGGPKVVVSPPKKEPPLRKVNPESENSENLPPAIVKQPKLPSIPLLPGNVNTPKIETPQNNTKKNTESNPVVIDKNPKPQIVESSTPTPGPALNQPDNPLDDEQFEPEEQMTDEDDDDNKVDQSNLNPQLSVGEKSRDSDSQNGIHDTQPEFGMRKSESDVPMSRPAFQDEPGSNFFFYFLFAMFVCILAYVSYNNKSKIFALILEGRRSHSGRGGRRKHTAAYRKLDTNLEEAITSTTPSGRTSQIIY